MKNAVFWDVMPCSFVRTDVSEERVASFIRMTIIYELRTSAVTSNRRTLRSHRISSERASVASYCQRFSYLTYSCHPDDGGAISLRNVASYKSHTE
jgi:hypothetical protein